MMVTDGWMPIETAPKDGTVFLAFGNGHGLKMIAYHIDEKPHPMHSLCRWIWVDGEKEIMQPDGAYRKEPCRIAEYWQCEFGFRPTHWMPLPPPPRS